MACKIISQQSYVKNVKGTCCPFITVFPVPWPNCGCGTDQTMTKLGNVTAYAEENWGPGECWRTLWVRLSTMPALPLLSGCGAEMGTLLNFCAQSFFISVAQHVFLPCPFYSCPSSSRLTLSSCPVTSRKPHSLCLLRKFTFNLQNCWKYGMV